MSREQNKAQILTSRYAQYSGFLDTDSNIFYNLYNFMIPVFVVYLFVYWENLLLLLHLHTALLTPDVWFFHTSRNSVTCAGYAGYPTVQFNSNTIYLELTSDFTG